MSHDDDLKQERALAEALAAYVDLVSREETVDREAFCKGYSGLEKDLRPLLESLDEMDGPVFAESAREKTHRKGYRGTRSWARLGREAWAVSFWDMTRG